MKVAVILVSVLLTAVSYAGNYDHLLPKSSMSLDEALKVVEQVKQIVDDAGKADGDKTIDINSLQNEIKALISQKEEVTVAADKKKDECQGNIICVKKAYEELRSEIKRLNDLINNKTGSIKNWQLVVAKKEENAKKQLVYVLEALHLAVLLRAMETEFHELKMAGYVLETPFSPEFLRDEYDVKRWFDQNGLPTNFYRNYGGYGLHFFYRSKEAQVEVIGLLVSYEPWVTGVGNSVERYDKFLTFMNEGAQTVGGISRSQIRALFTNKDDVNGGPTAAFTNGYSGFWIRKKEVVKF
jgi:hypothetical protein